TWELDVDTLDPACEAAGSARRFLHGFLATLASQDSIADHLPFYVGTLPYYPRLLATALAASLQRSLPANGGNLNALLGDPTGVTALLFHSSDH
ncbi:MAG: hypothetical protein R3E50_17340, partial [Halioglobus sp.]